VYGDDATLIDGTGADAVTDAAALIENGRISWAGPNAEAPATEATRTDLRGNTICPSILRLPRAFQSLPGASGSPLKRPAAAGRDQHVKPNLRACRFPPALGHRSDAVRRRTRELIASGAW
jgi:hypothetical protein